MLRLPQFSLQHFSEVKPDTKTPDYPDDHTTGINRGGHRVADRLILFRLYHLLGRHRVVGHYYQ